MVLRHIEKYVGNQWVSTRMSFLKRNDIVRWDDEGKWVVCVLDEDAYWSVEFNCYTAHIREYQLTHDFEFSDDMTHVIIKDVPTTNK